jgi:RES domain-containing protein
LLEGLKIVREAFARTVRLVSTADRRPSVLRTLVDDADLGALWEIEGATSTRLVAQDRGLENLNAAEFVFGVPHAKFVNAAFAYAKPRELNRFNDSSRGAWYAALDVQTCLREVAFHMTRFLGHTGEYRAVIEYVELHASLAGEFVDLRESDHVCLGPDPGAAYPLGNALASAARTRGLNGIIYPSVRHDGGTCFAALWPHAVQSVAQGAYWRLEWDGDPVPAIQQI